MVNSLNYVDENINKKQKENSVISRLFKWVLLNKLEQLLLLLYLE
jgi:hypothetical protein